MNSTLIKAIATGLLLGTIGMTGCTAKLDPDQLSRIEAASSRAEAAANKATAAADQASASAERAADAAEKADRAARKAESIFGHSMRK
jgi:hypothetical protein